MLRAQPRALPVSYILRSILGHTLVFNGQCEVVVLRYETYRTLLCRYKPGMSREECEELVLQAVTMVRDAI
jgi:hypothetical protein